MWRKGDKVGMSVQAWIIGYEEARMVGSKMRSIFQGLLAGIYSSICHTLSFSVTVITYKLIKPATDVLSNLGVISVSFASRERV